MRYSTSMRPSLCSLSIVELFCESVFFSNAACCMGRGEGYERYKT